MSRAWSSGLHGVEYTALLHPDRSCRGQKSSPHVCDRAPATRNVQPALKAYSTAPRMCLFGWLATSLYYHSSLMATMDRHRDAHVAA